MSNKTRKWFYYGFVKRFDMSVRKISSVGQKLPPADWEAQMVNMRGRVRHRQGPKQPPDGSVVITGIRDTYYFNTDHVPEWYESVYGYPFEHPSV